MSLCIFVTSSSTINFGSVGEKSVQTLDEIGLMFTNSHDDCLLRRNCYKEKNHRILK